MPCAAPRHLPRPISLLPYIYTFMPRRRPGAQIIEACCGHHATDFYTIVAATKIFMTYIHARLFLPFHLSRALLPGYISRPAHIRFSHNTHGFIGNIYVILTRNTHFTYARASADDFSFSILILIISPRAREAVISLIS